jgi:SAM-dependent methyltransferase
LPPLPRSTFGGVETAQQLDPGHLFWCPRCDLRFRHPYPDQPALTALYENLPATVWAFDNERDVWGRLLPLLRAYRVNDTILDVGCFRGDFLHWLPGGWRKLGIEPNVAARAVAARRGIRLVGSTIEDAAVSEGSVGAVTILDVLEHLHQPLEALARLRHWLAPGGSIFVFTGAADTLPWRFCGRHYWYSALPEHVTFFSLRWFRWAARQLGMRVRAHAYLASERQSRKRWLLQGTRATLYTAVQQARSAGLPERLLCGLPLLGRAARWRHVPWWTEAADHILVVLS